MLVNFNHIGMDMKEIKTKSGQELELVLKEFREELRKLSFDLAEKKLKNVGKISESRKTIARILTLLRSRRASEGQTILNKKHGEK
jgi:large subunit ribosomal protein L29